MIEEKLKNEYIREIIKYSPNKNFKYGIEYLNYVRECFEEYIKKCDSSKSIEEQYKIAYKKSLERFGETN